MFHTVTRDGIATRCLRNGVKCYINFIDNSLLFITMKEFSKWLTVDEVIAKSSTPRFLKPCNIPDPNNLSVIAILTRYE